MVARALCGWSHTLCAWSALSHVQHRSWCEHSCACLGLLSACLTLCRALRPGLWCGSQQETLYRNTTMQPLSRHKIFCRDRNGLALGKLCHDIRDPCRDTNTLSQPQTLSQHKIYVATLGQKSLSRQRKPMLRPKPPSMPGNPIVTRRSLS